MNGLFFLGLALGYQLGYQICSHYTMKAWKATKREIVESTLSAVRQTLNEQYEIDRAMVNSPEEKPKDERYN